MASTRLRHTATVFWFTVCFPVKASTTTQNNTTIVWPRKGETQKFVSEYDVVPVQRSLNQATQASMFARFYHGRIENTSFWFTVWFRSYKVKNGACKHTTTTTIVFERFGRELARKHELLITAWSG